MNGSPVPVPKESLFKTSMDPAKAKVKAATPVKAKGKTIQDPSTSGAAIVAWSESHTIEAAKQEYAQAHPTSGAPAVQGVPLIKAKAAPKATVAVTSGASGTVIPVMIPYDLAQAIANKPSTGGGWQALMGEVQKVLVVLDPAETLNTHVLNLTPYLLNKLVDKATLYGPGGGYQGVMKSIVCFAVKQHPGQILKGGQ